MDGATDHRGLPNDTAPRWLLRDRDAVYGDVFRRRVAGMGITEVITTYPYASGSSLAEGVRVDAQANVYRTDFLMAYGNSCSRAGDKRTEELFASTATV